MSVRVFFLNDNEGKMYRELDSILDLSIRLNVCSSVFPSDKKGKKYRELGVCLFSKIRNQVYCQIE